MGIISSKKNTVEAKYSSLNGVYPSCAWEPKTIRKIILEKRLAPLYPGAEEKTSPFEDECPICMLVGAPPNSLLPGSQP